ncbi:hypothetical protein ACJROX_19440 [Pseudalkalibacillus sp. A8]|uniref:hypothetical protein n=1 Tax=Pseudalkalibacillus sp. A8 TaxID=3382641 RepID=UPI0038B5D3B9
MKIQIHTIAIAAIFGIFTSPSRWWLCSFLILYFLFNKHRFSIFACILIISTYLFFLVYTPFYISYHGTQLPSNTVLINGKIISTPVMDGTASLSISNYLIKKR